MDDRLAFAAVAAALVAPFAASADQRQSLADFPVTTMAVVEAEAYTAASALAGAGGAPVEIALAAVGQFEGRTQHIIQVNESSEAPAATRVTVVRAGLLDDAISAERWDFALERTVAGAWAISEVRKAWRCRRGEHPDALATASCP
jgi:hypothetical protein